MRVARSLWTGSGAGLIIQVGTVASTLVLTRLLAPEAFGVVALGVTVTAALGAVLNVGLAPLIVAFASPDVRDVRRLAGALFWVLGAVGLALGLLLAVFAAPVAKVLVSGGADGATTTLRLLILAFAVRLPAAASRALLQRDLRLSRVYAVDVASVLAYSTTQISLAILTDLGPVGLALGHVVLSFVVLAGLSFAERPSRLSPRSMNLLRKELRQRASYIRGSLLVAALEFVGKHLDYVLVSTTLGAAALGQYYVAFVLPTLLRQRIAAITADVLLPLYAQSRSDSVDRIFAKACTLNATAMLPLLVVLSVLADPIVSVTFGEGWTGAAVILPIIAVATALDALSQPASVLLLAQRRSSALALCSAGRLLGFVAAVAGFEASGKTGGRAIALAVVVGAAVHLAATSACLAATQVAHLRIAITASWPLIALAAPYLIVAALLPSASEMPLLGFLLAISLLLVGLRRQFFLRAVREVSNLDPRRG